MQEKDQEEKKNKKTKKKQKTKKKVKNLFTFEYNLTQIDECIVHEI